MMATTENSAREVNEIILSEMQKQGISIPQMAKRMQVSINSIHHILKRPSIQTQRLKTICVVLQVNIFRIMAEEMDLPNPKNPKLEQVKNENKILKEVITLLGGNKS